MGEFNGWDRQSFPCKVDDYGVWSITLPKRPDGTPALKHDSKYKCHLVTEAGEHVDRVPAWTRFSRQNPESHLYEAVFWNPPTTYKWQSERPKRPRTCRIYEAHVGMVPYSLLTGFSHR